MGQYVGEWFPKCGCVIICTQCGFLYESAHHCSRTWPGDTESPGLPVPLYKLIFVYDVN